jgi:hypothetical protein
VSRFHARMFRRLCLMAAATVLLASCASPYPAAEPPIAVVPPPQLQAGDTWVYVQVNGYNRLPVRTLTDTLRVAAGGLVVERRSDRPVDSLETETLAGPWRQLGETAGGVRRAFNAPLARIPFPIAPGHAWREQVVVSDQYGANYLWSTYGRALGWERVTTPAGEFVALRVERQMNLGDYDGLFSDTEVTETYWYAPQVKRWIRLEHRYDRHELMVRQAKRIFSDWIVWELTEYRPAGVR